MKTVVLSCVVGVALAVPVTDAFAVGTYTANCVIKNVSNKQLLDRYQDAVATEGGQITFASDKTISGKIGHEAVGMTLLSSGKGSVVLTAKTVNLDWVGGLLSLSDSIDILRKLIQKLGDEGECKTTQSSD